MAIYRFHEKAVALFGKKQTAQGTPEALAGTDAIAALELDWKETQQTSEYEYAGDALSRDVETDIEDVYVELSFGTFMPVSNTAGQAPALAVFAEACGAATVTTASSVELTNAQASNAIMTQEFRRSSADIATQKTYKIMDAVGTVDLEVEVGKKAQIKFNFMGNRVDAPSQETALTSDFGNQKTYIAARPQAANISISEIGTVDTVGSTKNICFHKLAASNFFGFNYDRVLLGCFEDFSKGAVANDFTVTVLEDAANNNFDPYQHRGENFSFTLGWGTGAGKDITIYFAKAQLVDIQPTTVGTWAGLDLTFKNRDISSIKFT